MTIIASVLRSGGDFNASHVRRLARQLPEDVRHVSLSDVPISGIETIPLQYGWPRFYPKLELFNPNTEIGDEDILYIDLDSTIVGSLEGLLAQQQLTMLCDFYRCQEGLKVPASGVMFIPHEVKPAIWEDWIRTPNYYMRKTRSHPCYGDQGVIQLIAERQEVDIAFWQDLLPGRCLSYKVHIACRGMPGFHGKRSKGNGTVPDKARIISFHGRPRPEHVIADWNPSLEIEHANTGEFLHSQLALP